MLQLVSSLRESWAARLKALHEPLGRGDIPAPSEELIRRVVRSSDPQLAICSIEVISDSFNSYAVDVNGEWIYKFPKTQSAIAALRNEALKLAAISRYISLSVPIMEFHEGNPSFSRHRRIDGTRLVWEIYSELSETERQALSDDLSKFFMELHSIPVEKLSHIDGVRHICNFDIAQLTRRVPPRLPPAARQYFYACIMKWQEQSAVRYEKVVGHFDCHGYNMAFDAEKKRLVGVFDFAELAFDDLNREFSFLGWISRDLIKLTADRYCQLTGRAVDVDRAELYHALYRFKDLAEFTGGGRKTELENVMRWCEGCSGFM